ASGRLIRSNSANAYAHHMLPTARVISSATLVLKRLTAVPRGRASGEPPFSAISRRAAASAVGLRRPAR
ncbi:MAG: hypothetical protein ACRDOE_12115, partial [Streptosporangiaceae bacterium]